MPQIDIKHFIAYLTYNNNNASFKFEDASTPYIDLKEIQVDYTTMGAAVFCLQDASFKQKIEYYSELDRLLRQEFGHGLAVAIAPESDCSNSDQIAYFCNHMKEINPAITTMIFGEATGYIPRDEDERLRTLQDTWKHEPYFSAPLLSNVGVQERESSISAILKPGIDYVAKRFEQGGVKSGYRIIHDVLGVDIASVPRNNYETREYVSVNPEQAEKIQRIADQAYCRAMDKKPLLAEVLRRGLQ